VSIDAGTDDETMLLAYTATSAVSTSVLASQHVLDRPPYMLGVTFCPCGRKTASVCHLCPSTGTDKSGKLTLFSVPATLIHQTKTPNHIIVQT